MHMHFGLGAANTLAAIAAGADVAHVAVSGIGEGAGNTPLEDVVLSLKCLYGVETRVKTEKFCETSASSSARLPTIIRCRPTARSSGRDVFIVESGIGVMFFENAEKKGDRNHRLVPARVGRPAGLAIRPGQEERPVQRRAIPRQIGKTLDKDKQSSRARQDQGLWRFARSG